MKYKNYPDIPRSFDRGSDGSLKYPDRDSYYEALRAYAKRSKIDPDKLIAEWQNYINGCYKIIAKNIK